MTNCKECSKKVGWLQRRKLGVALRVMKRAVKRFKLTMDVSGYENLCKKCFLKKAEARFEALKQEIYEDAHKRGRTPEQLVAEVKAYIKKQVSKKLGRMKIKR